MELRHRGKTSAPKSSPRIGRGAAKKSREVQRQKPRLIDSFEEFGDTLAIEEVVSGDENEEEYDMELNSNRTMAKSRTGLENVHIKSKHDMFEANHTFHPTEAASWFHSNRNLSMRELPKRSKEHHATREAIDEVRGSVDEDEELVFDSDQEQEGKHAAQIEQHHHHHQTRGGSSSSSSSLLEKKVEGSSPAAHLRASLLRTKSISLRETREGGEEGEDGENTEGTEEVRAAKRLRATALDLQQAVNEWCALDMENGMIKWLRDRSNARDGDQSYTHENRDGDKSYTHFIVCQFPENIRLDGVSGEVTWIDERVVKPEWRGTFDRLSADAADDPQSLELHVLGSAPPMTPQDAVDFREQQQKARVGRRERRERMVSGCNAEQRMREVETGNQRQTAGTDAPAQQAVDTEAAAAGGEHSTTSTRRQPFLFGWWTSIYALIIILVNDGTYSKSLLLMLLGGGEAFLLWLVLTDNNPVTGCGKRGLHLEKGPSSSSAKLDQPPKTRGRKMSRPNPLFSHVSSSGGVTGGGWYASDASGGVRTDAAERSGKKSAAAAAAAAGGGEGVALQLQLPPAARKVSTGAILLLSSAKKGQSKSRLLRTPARPQQESKQEATTCSD
jgi:hypothetical protein